MLSQVRGARVPGSDALIDVEITDGCIASVGPSGSLPRAEAAIEAEGRTLTSGLWDEHVHLRQWALSRSRIDLRPAASAAEALALLARSVADADGNEVVAMRARAASWPDRLDREALDRVARSGSEQTRIVVVGADLHGCWLNSAALAARGRAASGDGHLVEDECFAVVRELDRSDPESVDREVSAAARAAAARGVVGVVDLEMRWELGAWQRRELAGFDVLRVESGIYPDDLERAITEGLRTGDAIGPRELVRVGPLKIVMDGSLGTGTAWCCAPYADTGGTGRALRSGSELRALMRRAHGAGLGLAIHAIGDRANAEVLDAYAELGIGGRIEHAQLVRRDDVPRFGALGVVASVQPGHLLDDRATADRRWPDRANDAFPLASLLASGARLAFGSDAPVAPLDPWLAIRAAVTRQRDDDAPWAPGQRISVTQALAASMRGRLAPQPGDAADLVLLDADPLRVAPHELDRLPVATTLLGGRVTFGPGVG